MGSLLRLPGIRALHRRQLLFPTFVLIVVAAVLVQGSLDRNASDSEAQPLASAAPVVVSEPRPVIRADLEKTPLTYFSDYWNQLASEARENLVLVGPTATPGILVGPRLALTTVQPALEIVEERRRVALTQPTPPASEDEEESGDTQASAAPDDVDREAVGQDDPSVDGAGPFRLRAWDETLGLALFDVPNAGEGAFTLSDSRRLPSGSYLGAVTLDPNGEPTVTPGHLVSTAAGIELGSAGDLIISMDLPSTLSVAAVINLDGSMVGLAYASPEGPRVVTTTEMLGLIEALQAEQLCRSIEVSDLNAEVRRQLNLEGGVLVEYVHAPAFSPEPSLQAGDILLEWGDTPLESTAQFEGLYDAQVSGSLVRYRVLRGRRRVTGGTLMPGRNCAPIAEAPVRLPRFGLAVQWTTAPEVSEPDLGSAASYDWYVVAVAPDGSAAVTGVQEGDRVVAIDGDPVDDERDRATLETAAGSDDALLLSLRRGERAKLVAVPPLLESAAIRLPLGSQSP